MSYVGKQLKIVAVVIIVVLLALWFVADKLFSGIADLF